MREREGRAVPVFLALLVAYLFSQFFRSFLAIVAQELTRDLGLGPSELGHLSAMWFATFALAQFPIGYALDRIGPRRTVGVLMFTAVAGAGLFAAAPSYPVLLAGMALIGVGCAPVLMGTMVVFGRTQPPERFALLSTLFIGLGALGVIGAATPLSIAIELFGWRMAMFGIAALTALSAALVIIVVDELPSVHSASRGSAVSAVIAVATIPALRAILPLALVSYAVVAAERSLWIGPFLSRTHGLAGVPLGNAVLAMSLAMAIGAMAYGPLERLFGSAKRVTALGSAATAAAFLALGGWQAAPLPGAVALITAVGLFGMTYGTLMAHARLFFPDHLLGRGVTFMNFIFIAGAGLLQSLSGMVVNRLGASGLDPASTFGLLHLAFGAILAGAVAAYLFAPERPVRG